jgi:hypothetical protein
MSQPENIEELRRYAPPIWRGLGFLLILLMPVIAISGAITLIDYGLKNRWPLYWPLVGYIQAPAWMWQIPLLNRLAAWIVRTPHILGITLLSLILLVVLYMFLSMFYAFLYRRINSRYLPTDIRPPKVKTRRYRR